MMQTQRSEFSRRSSNSFWLRLLKNNVLLLLFLVLAIVGMGIVYSFFSPTQGDADLAAEVASDALTASLVKDVPAKPVLQRLAQSAGPLRIGIISGHKGFDSGAVCADGLTEATVNANLAERLAANLQARGIRAEILEEFDGRLPGYSATALISIHADSCTYINDLATGFKISGSPAAESDRLANCMETAYGASTELPYHANTITADMANYHAFREIAPGTPAIIIEVGFMYLDRDLLTTNTDPVILGLIDGITYFLEADD
jgi:N-acetylmuramoyl-L-alanine amidase